VKNIHLFVILILSIFLGCSRSQKSNIENPNIVHLATINLEDEDAYSNQYRKLNYAHSGNYYSSIDSVTHYGAGYCKAIPDSLLGYNLSVYISVWVREKISPIEGEIGVSLNVGDKLLDWKSIGMKNIPIHNNEWIQLSDSFFYPAKLLFEKKTYLKVFAMKDSGKDFFDIDDLEIKYKFSK
jgi:hypothetical protein